MRSEKEIIAHRSLIELPQWIEEVFTGRSDHPAALKKLLASFTPAFNMVTTAGHTVGLEGVENLFRNNIGFKPDLRVEIDACETLGETDKGVICRYRETHHEKELRSVRRSVVIINIDEGRPCWHYLHETAVAD